MTALLIIALVIPLALVGVLLAFNRALPFLFQHLFVVLLACGTLQLFVLALDFYERPGFGVRSWFSVVGAVAYVVLAFQLRTRERAG